MKKKITSNQARIVTKNKFWNYAWERKHIFMPEKTSYNFYVSINLIVTSIYVEFCNNVVTILNCERKLKIFKLFITMFDVFKMFNRNWGEEKVIKKSSFYWIKYIFILFFKKIYILKLLRIIKFYNETQWRKMDFVLYISKEVYKFQAQLLPKLFYVSWTN